MPGKILILGGTTDARQLAAKLAARGDLDVTLSLAGRTEKPAPQPVPVRTGGFGGADGLAAYLAGQGINLLIDATHPYAARISANAAVASEKAGVKLIALRRTGWQSVAGDRWTPVENAQAAVTALGDKGRNVFLALGRQELAPFEAAPQHSYLIRSVDPVTPPLDVPNARYILGRGPFDETEEAEMLSAAGIEAIVSKNSGGSASYGKIAAARALGIEVVMLQRPVLPDVMSGGSAEDVYAMAVHALGLAKRGE